MSDVYHRGTESQRETFNFPDAGRLERKPFNPTRVVTGREPRSQDKILSVASGSIPKPTRTDLARYVQRRTVSAVSGRFPPCLGASVVNLTHECPESGLVVAPREARGVFSSPYPGGRGCDEPSSRALFTALREKAAVNCRTPRLSLIHI